ncbi:MAG: hypothetical protein R3F07_06695 [Opitutaceae bacterium]
MIAFDTNYLVRHIVQDDPAQCRVVSSTIETETAAERSIRIFDLVLLETAWVLQAVYAFDHEALWHVLNEIAGDSAFSFDDPIRLRSALAKYRRGTAEFADCLISIAAKEEGLELKTFDKPLRKEIP